MTRALAIAVLATVSFAIGAPPVAAQAPTPIHESQYPDVDIAYGSSLYAARCVTCHGAQGDAIGGVNLRSGKFRNAVTRQRARALHQSRVAGRGDAAVRARQLRDGRHRRLSSQHELVRYRDREGGRRRARPRHLRGQRRLRRVPSRRPRRLARGPRISATSDRSAAPDRCSARSSIRPAR